MLAKGLFVVLDGIDGTGKTTLSKCLEKQLSSLGYKVFLTAEPTSGTIGSILRNTDIGDSKAEALMFVADRALHTKEMISRVDDGEIVICDRYYASTLAYQSSQLDDTAVDIEWLKQINDGVIVEPDLTFILDLDPEETSERVDNRGERSRFERLEYQKRVRDCYLRIAKERNFIITDASLPAEQVCSEVLAKITDKLR